MFSMESLTTKDLHNLTLRDARVMSASTTTPKEHALDSSLLSGTLDVDAYASELLKTHSLEHALKENKELERENRELKAKLAKWEAGRASEGSGTADDEPDAKRRPAWYEELFKDEFAALDESKLQGAREFKDSAEKHIAALTKQRDELLAGHSAFENRWRAIDELNRTHAARNSFLEKRLDEEIERRERYVTIACGAFEQGRRRRWLKLWMDATCMHERKQEARAKRFRDARLGELFVSMLRVNAEEQRRVRAGKARIAKVTLGATFRAWMTQSRETNRSERVAMMFAKGRETLKVRFAFAGWKEVCRLNKATIAGDALGSPNKPRVPGEMTLGDLREAAAAEKVPAIVFAARRGYKSLILQLIEEGSAVNMKSRSTGTSPLHAAAEGAHSDVVEILLEAGANPSVADDSGETPLHCAARAGSDACVDVALALLRHGANPSCVTEQDGKSALQLATEVESSPRMVSVLLQYRARIDQQQSHTGRTPLHAASARADSSVVRVLLDHARKEAMGRTIGKHFPRDSNQQTPLHLACASDSAGTSACVNLLVEADFDVNATSNSGESPLHILCKNPAARTEDLDAFVGHANWDCADYSGNTPLHFACSAHANNRAVALRLVELGAPLYILNSDGQSPLDLVPQGFAIRLLGAVCVPPFLNRAARAHKNLVNCMICKEAVDVGFLRRRVADHCRRCGRLCCAKCAKSRAVLIWSNYDPSLRTAAAPYNAGPGEDDVVVIDPSKAVKVCEHCAEILKGDVELTLSDDTAVSAL